MIVFLSVLLIFSLFGANAALGVDRGVLNPDRATTAMDESGAYTIIHAEASETLTSELEGESFHGLNIAMEDIVDDIISPELIQYEVERHVEDAYQYLEGDVERFVVRLDVAHLEGQTSEAIHEELERTGYAAVGMAELDEMSDGEEQYEEVRLNLRSQFMTEAGFDPNNGFGYDELAQMRASLDGFEAQQAAFRADVVDGMLEEADAEDGFAHPEISALLDNESSFESTQAEFRATQRERIQEETDRHLSQDELERAYDEQQDEIVETTAEHLAEDFEAEGLPEDYNPPVEPFVSLTAHALATDLSYESFRDRYDDELAALEMDLQSYVATSGDTLAEDIQNSTEVSLPSDAPDSVAQEMTRLETLVIEATTTEMAFEEFILEYESIAADIQTAVAHHALDHPDEFREDMDSDMVGTLESVPDELEEEVHAFEDVVLRAILSDKYQYTEFKGDLSMAEEQLIDALVSHIFADAEFAQSEVVVSEEVESDAAEELSIVRTIVNMLGPVGIALFVVSAGLVGGIVAATRQLTSAGIVVGTLGVLVGSISTTIAFVLPDLVIGVGMFPSDYQAVVTEILSILLWPWAVQSIVIAVLGGGIIGLGVAIRWELIDLRAEDSPNDDEA